MDSLLLAASLALADVSTALREEFPQLYARVDAILKDPERGIQHDYPKSA